MPKILRLPFESLEALKGVAHSRSVSDFGQPKWLQLQSFSALGTTSDE